MKLVSLLTFVLAQTAMETPSIGVMLDASGFLRPVYGVAGNFTVGPPVEGSDEQRVETLVERRGNSVYVFRPDRTVLDTLPSTADLVLAIARGVLFTDGGQLILRRPDASQVSFLLTEVVALRIMSTDWVQVTTSGGVFALRVEGGREALFALPGSARAEVRRR